MPHRVLIDAVVRAAHGLGIRTVAECVEHSGLVPALRSLGVDAGQGYHLGRPIPLDDLLGRTAHAWQDTLAVRTLAPQTEG